MAYKVNKLDMWTGEVDDQVGGLASKLEPLATAKADLDLVIARRQPHLPGKGIMFLGPITSAKAKKAAATAGLAPAPDLVALRVEGQNKPGECHRLTSLLADEGINLRGVSATAFGNKFVVAFAFDNDADATRAMTLIRKAGAKRK